MLIDEAIVHAREVTEKQKSKYENCPTRSRYNCEMCFHNPKCNVDAKEHEQLAKWLEELKAYRLFIKMCEDRKYVVHSDIFAKDCKEFIAEQLKDGRTDEH